MGNSDLPLEQRYLDTAHLVLLCKETGEHSCLLAFVGAPASQDPRAPACSQEEPHQAGGSRVEGMGEVCDGASAIPPRGRQTADSSHGGRSK